MKTRCLIALGSNLPSAVGAGARTLDAALGLMAETGLQVTARSRPYRTPAHPPGAGPDFVNAAAAIETDLEAHSVLAILHAIEHRLGRTRNRRWEARVLDLDLLSHGQAVLPDRQTFERWRDIPAERQSEDAPGELVLPHPRLQDRAFVLVPLAEIAPDWRHPVLGLTTLEMLQALDAAALAGIEAM